MCVWGGGWGGGGVCVCGGGGVVLVSDHQGTQALLTKHSQHDMYCQSKSVSGSRGRSFSAKDFVRGRRD